MHVFPTEEEVKLAAKLLVETYKVSPQLIGQLFDTKQREQANSILQSLGGKKLTTLDVAKLLIQRDGPSLFAGSREVTRKLRLHLLEKIPDEKIRELFTQHQGTNTNISSTSRMRKPLAEMKWHSGKHWATDFVTTLGFPAIFAGFAKGLESVPTIHDVPPKNTPPDLADFQKDIKKRMLDVLQKDEEKTRCVVTLPTGGGKTRVAVEAYIDWMQPRFAMGKYLLWIAQSEELCEQAIACIEQMWGSREFVGTLRIYRFFGRREISLLDDLRGGAVVSSIQQLHSRIKSGDPALEKIIKDTGAMIVDEAHRAVSPMYDTLLKRAEEICGTDLFPICGLTATPGRAGLNSTEETSKLVGRFEAYLIKPNLGQDYEKSPLRYFREQGFLARAIHVLYKSGIEYTLTDEEVEAMNKEQDLPSGFLKRLAGDKNKNLQIIQRLLKLPKGTPVLVQRELENSNV